MGFEPGNTFGKYTVHERIASGGMGEVWLATARGPSGFEKRVVLKTILPHLANRADFVLMLINEASIAARLSHPNVVQVFDLDCVDGTYFLAMEHLTGRTLAQMLQRVEATSAPMPPWMALSVVASCCDGLQYVHDYAEEDGRPLGLVHRDVSPSNVMVSFSGNVTVLDFGVAVATTRMVKGRRRLEGKYHYMAPERVRGMPGDRRADVYSLGVLLYELLTQEKPYRAGSDHELLLAIGTRPPVPMSRHAPGIAPELEAIVAKAMAAEPRHRYAEARLLAADLRAYLRELDLPREAEHVARYVRGLFPEAASEPGAGMTAAIGSPAEGLSVAPGNDPEDEWIDIEMELSDVAHKLPPLEGLGGSAAGSSRPTEATSVAELYEVSRASTQLAADVFTPRARTSTPAPRADIFAEGRPRRAASASAADDAVDPVAPAKRWPFGGTPPRRPSQA